MSQKIKWLAWGLILVLLIGTRFIGISWGLPFPFHPDERNMAVAIQQLQCTSVLDLNNCFNPHFFAYGQFPLYLGYILVLFSRVLTHNSGAVSFNEAVLALRTISAFASLLTVYFSLRIIRKLILNTQYSILYVFPFIFSPALIQYAHFGTTESLLMLFLVWLLYLCLKLRDLKKNNEIEASYVQLGFITGLAIATKASAVLFLLTPLIVITSIYRRRHDESKYQSFWQLANVYIFVGFIAGAVAIIFSPHTIISFKDFFSSVQYESEVALGTAQVFYTRTFDSSIPVLFQLQRIFPYALGWPTFFLFLVGIFSLPKNWNHNLLRVSFLVLFIPWAFTFTKWTRFMAPLFPLMIIIAVLGTEKLFQHSKKLILVTLFVMTLSGILFIRIYLQEDIRLTASRWMVNNIPKGSTVLQETANVVDLPLLPSTFNNISFNFYDLDSDKKLQEELKKRLKTVDYIVIPSRRIFKNHSQKKYPILSKYYQDLFSGKLGFKQVAEFKVFDDEDAEETWSVFDHPVIRIYKKI